tara:strand:+ start:24 stop:1040 length:1017 start_codon:yes stop_codon:yes gene_type:complete
MPKKGIKKMNNFNYEPDPEVTKVRDQIIKKIGNKPLDEVNLIIKKLLSGQMDEITRLGALAARVKIIRLRIEELYETKVPKKFKKVEVKNNSEKVKESEKKKEDWLKVKMLEPAEVNEKQIDKGVILDVSKIDGQKLIESKKAIALDNEKNKTQYKEESQKEDGLKKEVKSENNIKKDEQQKSESNDGLENKGTSLLDKKKDIEQDADNKPQTELDKKLKNDDLEKKEDEGKLDIEPDNEKISIKEKITKDEDKNLESKKDIEKVSVQSTESKKNGDKETEKSEIKIDNNEENKNKINSLDNKTDDSNNFSSKEKVGKKKDEADLLEIHEKQAKNEEK